VKTSEDAFVRGCVFDASTARFVRMNFGPIRGRDETSRAARVGAIV